MGSLTTVGGWCVSCERTVNSGSTSVSGVSNIPRARICVPASISNRQRHFDGKCRSGRPELFCNGQAVDRRVARFKTKAPRSLVSSDIGEHTSKKDMATWCDAVRDGLKEILSEQSFAKSGEISEENMETLVEALVGEDGQSLEDYRSRADMFEKTAAFFKDGREYSRKLREPCTEAEISTAMQALVEIVLAEDGRSVTDYNCRAQVFSKSAEIFTFTSDPRSS